jgi:DNA-binding PadR family transcriptional regulator
LTLKTDICILPVVRRKPGSLVPLEQRICIAAADLLRRGHSTFHGYEIAKTLADAADARLLTAYGTLYRALGRLEEMGLLKSRAEDPAIAAREGRPGRRLYALTAPGEQAAREARAATASQKEKRPRRRLAPA